MISKSVEPQTFARWVRLSENQAAQLAVQRVADCLAARRSRRAVNPLFLHGPSGTGKSHLVSALIAAVTRQAPDLTVTRLTGADFATVAASGDEARADLDAARQADLLVVEDVQHLPPRAVETLVGLIDTCQAREQQLVLTATAGPAQLTNLPVRLTSRLASGLAVGLLPLSPASRLVFLRDRAERRAMAVDHSVLAWLAENVSGSVRELEGAMSRVETLVRLLDRLPDADDVAAHFRPEASAHRPTVERIAQRVGRYFQVAPDQLQSRQRSRHALLPRQIGMYLARQLTALSLQQIGAYFGGRDHSTVLHACRKVELALERDLSLSGAVRQLHADLA